MSSHALIVTGSIASGKSSVVDEAGYILTEQAIPHAVIDFDFLCEISPRELTDRYGSIYGHENLRCMVANARKRSVDRFIVATVIESRSDVQAFSDSLGVEPVVARLVAPVTLLQARARAREVGGGRDWHVARAGELHEILEKARLEDFTVDGGDRPLREVASEVLLKAGWLDA